MKTDDAPWSWREQLRFLYERAAGTLMLCLGQIRRLRGLSYYPLRGDPILHYRGQITVDVLRRTLRIPPVWEGRWINAGTVSVVSGKIYVCDPMFLPKPMMDLTVVVPDVPTGRYALELQMARLRSPYRHTVLRARVLWAECEEPHFEEAGHVGVDSGQLCVVDPENLEGTWPDKDAGGFDPFGLLGKSRYAAIDPAGGNNRYLNVFTSGLGDGCYPVFVLHQDGRRCGVVVDMTPGA